ncbi:MAG TPA: Ig-like domain-containing protein [Thermoanaerobaculia bacterium]|jgi:VCBS repeat-containing protein
MTRTRGVLAALFLLVLTAIPAQAATTDFRVLLDTDHDGTTGCVVAGMPGVDLVFRTQVTTTDTAATVTRTSRQLCTAGALGEETGIDTTVWPALLQPASGALAVESMIPFSAFGGTLDDMRIGVQATSGAAVHTALVRPDGSPALYPGLSGKRRSVSAPGAPRTITLDGNDADWFGITPFLNGIAGSGTPGLRMVKVSTFADVVTDRLYFLFDANISTDAPIASDDEYDRPAGSNLTIPAPGVLSNDSDVTGQPLTATPVSPAEHGNVVLNPDGSFTYTPDDPSTTDSDEFEYKASNGTKESTPARVRINVALVGNSTPVGNNDSYNATEDAQLSVAAKGVLQNDHDGNGDPLKATLVTGPSHGTVVLNQNGGFTYTPAVNFFGTDTFTYKVSDGTASDTAVVTISIAGVNDAPAVHPATFSVDENSSEGTVVGTVTATDVEGDDVSFAITGGDPDDAFEIDANTGKISVANPAALDRETTPEFDLEIRATDSGAPAATDDGPIRVNIGNVDEAPEVADHELSTDEDTPLPITLTGNDPEATPLTFTIVQAPLHGTLSGTAPNIIYTPAPDFAGSDAFVYTAGDGVFDSSVSTVAITINPINDAPVGNVDVYATIPGVGFSISPNAGVLANDVDADGDPLVAVIVDPPSHGTIDFNLDGGFSYVPFAGYSGIDTFSYTVVEASSLAGARRGPQNMGAPVTVVSINVHATNTVPVANPQSVELDEDTQKIVTLTGTDADGDALQYNINTSPAHGTLNAAGPQVRYIPAPDFAGTDSFTFTMTDGFSSSSPATVSILVKPINDAPTVANDVYGTLRNTQLTVNAANGVLGNDQDVDNASLIAVLLSGPAHGTLTLNPNGSFIYTPTTGFSGSDSFRYRASDGVATSLQPARVTINVRTTNAAPVAHAATVNTDEDVAVGVTLTGTDPDGDTVELELVTQPANGVLTGSLPNLAYTPNPNFNGTDTFTFRASDGFVFSPAATITIVVGAVNDAPVAIAGAETVAEESTLNGSVAGLVTDVDSNSFTFSLVTNVNNGTLVLATNGTYTYTPDPNFSGSDAFGWVASDGSASSNMSLVTITVTDVNEAPVFTSTNATNVAENTTAVLTVTTSDFEADAIAYSITGGADAADFSINAATGALVFNAAPNFEAPADADGNNVYLVQVTANDGTDSTLQTITVTVTDVNEAPSFTSGTTATWAENLAAGTTAYTAAVTDPEGDTITFSIGGGADAAAFTINSSTGQLTFASARNFEAPADADANNVYTVQITANDGANSVNITVNVTVTDANEAPAITSSNSASVVENTTAVTTATATDEDGDAVTWSITGGADAADFSINATTGALTFNAAPDFETPADADTNNVYLVQVTVTDGSNASQQVISVTVTDANEAAVFASANSASLAENTTTSVLTVVANDPEGGSVTYSITGGADAGDFSINATTGALSFNALPNFEAPADADANNVYLVEVTANDGVSNTVQTITVTVTNANDAPVVTSSATLSVPENQHSILTLTSTDEDGDTVTWSVTGGADGTFFSVNSTTGALTFNMIPNFEIPSDANADNVWVAQITANDGTSTTNQVISVTITNVDEIPVFTSATSSMVPENQTAVMTVTATDPEGQAVTFAITAGADMAHFTINSVTGELSFVSAPNFENPADADADNSYVVGVQANDGTLQEMMAITVLVTNADEAPSITSSNSATIPENTLTAATVTATEPDGQTVSFSITGGADQALFSIDSSTGVLTFDAAPDFENPADAGSNNQYEVEVTAGDGTNTVAQTITVTVSDVNEAPAFTSGANVTVAEGTTAVTTVTTTDEDGDTVTYFITGGADAADFSINSTTGALTFNAAPDFETPADADTDNVYVVEVTANDGTDDTAQTITVTVTNNNEAPAITSANSASVAENTSAVLTATATDQEGNTITWSVTGGADAGVFSINATTGALSFNSLPDFEGPGDTGLNNEYVVEITANDGTNDTTQTITVTVTNVNEAATITSANTASVAENTTAVFTATATDQEGNTITWSIAGGADAGDFTINASTGALTFTSAPDFETAADADTNNQYVVTIRANDGTSDTDQAITVTVTDANEAPSITSANAASIAENTSAAIDVDATDVDAGTTLTFSISGGADAGDFSIDASTGALTFTSAPDFETPADADTSNAYVVEVTVTDGSLTDVQTITISVTNANEAPAITTGGTASVAENTTAVTDVDATDADAGTTLTFSISGGADAGAFGIVAGTGVLTFNSAPNFEAPGDADTNNQYIVEVTVSDGTASDVQTITVTVTNANEAPSITSANSASIAENTTAAIDVDATDVDAATTLTFSISGGADAGDFSINASTGALTFNSAPDFESPADADTDNAYVVEVTVTDGAMTDVQTITISVTNANEAPAITTGATASVAENTTAVTDVDATDADAGTTLTFSISGGADAGAFGIVAGTGVLTFNSAPNFEAPGDADTNNQYIVEVTVSDGTASDVQTITVTVTNANEAPSITSANAATIAENTTAAIDVDATDVDAGTTLTFSISGGADAGDFSINGTTGALTFSSAPDFESPADADTDNAYVVEVTVTDGSLTDVQTITISVTNANEAPAITTGSTASVAENTTAVTDVDATDADAGTTLTFSISGGADAADFGIVAATGVLTFNSAPDFEAPADADTNNQYVVEVTVSDGTASDVQTITVTVTNANEAPAITTGNTASVAENTTAVIDVDATDGDAGATLSFSITGGADGPAFSINTTTGVVTFNSAPDFESPADAGANNSYELEVTVTDGSMTDVQTITVTVTDANEAPAITTGNTASVAENTTAVTDVDATDVDAGTTLTFSISGGADAGDFGIVAATGVLTFNSAPDFEAPADADTNNQYVVEVTVSDGTATDVQTITVTVTDANEAPAITTGNTASVAENTTAVIDVDATDGDAGASLSFSISGGADGAAFSINATTGAVTFNSAPDFDTPADAGADNVYDVQVTVTDGSLTDVQSIAVSVTNENEGPSITSANTASVAENTAIAIDVNATDVDAGTTLTFSISGGADAGDFTINGSTGVLSFNPAPDFEAAADADANNEYIVEVTVSDGSLTDVQTITVTVTAVNEAPSFTSANTAAVPENTTAAIDVNTTDPEGNTVTYSVTGGADELLFTIDTNTGVLSFLSAPDFETPQDANTDNFYVVEVTANDGTNNATQTITVEVENGNELPTFTSTATPSVPENQTAVVTVATNDVDGDTVTYSITGGADAADFSINTSTGALTFNVAPNFEAPHDADTNNVYLVDVTADDGPNTVVQNLTVTVTAVNEAPAYTSNDTFSQAENTTAVTTVSATDPEGVSPTYTVTGGADAAKFTIGLNSGALSFVTAPDFDVAGDANADNVYVVQVTATDGANPVVQTISVTITGVPEAPVVSSSATPSVPENMTTAVDVNATDPEGATVTYAIAGGDDASDFSIDENSGVLTFIVAPDFEAPHDADTNNVYLVNVEVDDGTMTVVQNLTVTVTNVDEAPSITSLATATVNENQTSAIDVNATDPDAGATLVYSITGGADQAKFSIVSSTGVLTFLSAPNFESPTDAGADNVYDVSVEVTDGTNAALQSIAITVANVDEAPEFSSAATANVDENTTAVVDVDATDPEGAGITYSITGGADQALFSINSSTGVLTFASAPNFESPTDAGANNVYDVQVQASAGAVPGTQSIAVTVVNVNEAPVITITDNAIDTNEDTNVNMNGGAGSTLASIADPDGNVTVQVTLTATQGTLSLNGVTGVTFVPANASNDGVDDTTLVFTGTVSNVNARLNGMVYKPNLNYFGNADVDVSVSDLGNTGSGGTKTDGPDNIDITVIPVNDAPTATAKTHATHSGLGLTITAGSHAGALKDDADDVDDADNELTVQLFGSPSNTEALVQLDATTGTSLGSFYFDPPGGFSGAITFQYKVCDDNAGDPNQCSAATTVTVNVGGQETWFIDDAAACGVNCTGSRARPLIGLNTTDAQFLARGTGDSIFVNSGTYGTGITMNASERLIGQGSTSIQAALNHNYASYPVANGILDTLPSTSTPPSIGGTLNAAASTTVRGVAINSGANKGYVGTGASQTVLEASVTSGNTAVEMTNATTSSVTFSSTTSTGGTHGINLSNVSGTFDFGTGGSLPTDGLKNHTTAGFQLVNASAGTNVVDIDYSGVIQPGTGRAVVIGTTDGSSGANVSRGLEGASTVSLTGNMTGGGIAVYESVGGTLDLPGLLSFNTGANNALDLVDNDGTTFNLSNGNLTITTANGTGINATDGGTLNITGNDNTITTTGTGRAFNFAGTSAAAKMAGTLRFKSINKSGSNAKGIVVNNHSGTFTITGDDNNDNTPDSLTAGGTITGTTQRGAEFVAVDGAVSLAGMTFTNATTTDGSGVAADCGNTLETSATKHCNAPLYFDTLPGGTTLRSITVDGSVQNGIIGYDMTGLAMTSVTVKNGGSESSEAGGLAVRNLMGTNSITNSQFLNNTKDQVKIVNLASKNMISLTVLGSTFEGNRLDGMGNHIDAAGLIVTNNATIGTINIGNGSVAGANSFSDMFSNGVQYAGNGAAASVTFNVNKNSFDNVNAGIVVAHGSAGSGGSLTYNLSNNTIVAGPLSQGTAIQATGFQGHNLNGSIVGNTIGTQGVVGSGSQCNGCGNGIHIDHEGTGRCDVDIIGNTIQRVNSAAIQVTLLPLSAKGDIVITGNLVRDPDAGVFAGIYVKGGSTASSTNCVAATIGGSVTPGSWPSQTANAKNRVEGSWGSSIAVQRSGGTFNVPGFTPTVSAWITGNNSLVDPVMVLGSGYATGASCP